MKRAESVLFRLSAVWTAVGLASGLGYRELTRSRGFTGFTQLAVVHTHILVLGALTGLLLLLLVLGRRIRDTREPAAATASAQVSRP